MCELSAIKAVWAVFRQLEERVCAADNRRSPLLTSAVSGTVRATPTRRWTAAAAAAAGGSPWHRGGGEGGEARQAGAETTEEQVRRATAVGGRNASHRHRCAFGDKSHPRCRPLLPGVVRACVRACVIVDRGGGAFKDRCKKRRNSFALKVR